MGDELVPGIMRTKKTHAGNGGSNVVVFPKFGHWAPSACSGREKASTGTSPPESALSRLATLSEGSRRPAKMLRKYESEIPTASRTAATDMPLRLAHSSIGCDSDIDAIISTRNIGCQMEIFPLEMRHDINGLVKCGMGKRLKPAPRDMYLGEWIDFLDLKVIDVAKLAGCSQSYVSNIIAGNKKNINVLYLLAISDAMEVTVNDLYHRPPPKAMIAQLESYSPRAQATILARRQRKG